MRNAFPSLLPLLSTLLAFWPFPFSALVFNQLTPYYPFPLSNFPLWLTIRLYHVTATTTMWSSIVSLKDSWYKYVTFPLIKTFACPRKKFLTIFISYFFFPFTYAFDILSSFIPVRWRWNQIIISNYEPTERTRSLIKCFVHEYNIYFFILVWSWES